MTLSQNTSLALEDRANPKSKGKGKGQKNANKKGKAKAAPHSKQFQDAERIQNLLADPNEPCGTQRICCTGHRRCKSLLQVPEQPAMRLHTV